MTAPRLETAFDQAKSQKPTKQRSSTNVRVVGRIRPLAKYELEKGCNQVLHSLPSPQEYHNPDGPEVLQVDPGEGAGGKRWFELDAVFDEDSKQSDVYVKSGAQQSVTEDLFKGFNCTILAYGQTGAGKTFTMGTAAASEAGKSAIVESDGVIPRACQDLFDTIKQKCDGNCVVELSYLEVYNEEVRDLMSENKNNAAQLRIRETLDGEVYVRGLESRVVNSPADIGKRMEEASKRRVVASTKMNAASSRSHALAVLRIKGVLEDSTKFQSKLTLVDLAGSERIKKTGAAAGRAKEGININKGLFVLGQVVSALAEQRPKMKRKPPYRDSKLTRLLQDSLGGNSRTIMIACVSPADFNLEESVNTLRYATSARNIKNTATRNVVKSISPEEAAKLQRENQLLKQQVLDLQKQIERMTEELSDGELERSQNLLDAVAAEQAIPPEVGVEPPSEDDAGEKKAQATMTLDDMLEGDKQNDQNTDNKKKTYEELENEVVELKAALKQAKGDVRAALRDAAVELPETKKQVAVLQDQLQETKEIEQEAAEMAKELREVRDDASAAHTAADQLSHLVEEMSVSQSTVGSSYQGDRLEKKLKEYDFMRVEEAWVALVAQILCTFKEQMRRLGDYFHMVVQVVESPDICTMMTNRKKSWFGSENGEYLAEQANLRKKLMTGQVQFYNDRFLEIEDEITGRSEFMDAVLDSLVKDKEKLQKKLGPGKCVRGSFYDQSEAMLLTLTQSLVGSNNI